MSQAVGVVVPGSQAPESAAAPIAGRAVLLDRDGVLNRKPTLARYVRSWEEFEWLPGALEALRLFAEAGYRVIVISNQAGIARGVMTDEDVRRIHDRMRAEARAAGGRIDAVYYCPHDPESRCACRKPRPGMLLAAQRDFALDLGRATFIGDDERDGQASAAAGCRWMQVTGSTTLLEITRRLTGSSRPMRATLLVMALNEIDGMRVIMPRIRREWLDQILVVDGGSTDGTIEWARAQGYEVYVQRQPGFRSAYREVWPLITGEIVVYFTPDGNSIPEVIPELVARVRAGADLVIASRYLAGAKSEDDDAVTRFGNWVFRAFSNLLLNRRGAPRITDPLVMLRAHRKDLPGRLGLDREQAFVGLERLFRTRVDWIPLMSMRALRCGVRWEELPADEPPRIGGERKLRIVQWGSVYFLQLLREWLRPWRPERSSPGPAAWSARAVFLDRDGVINRAIVRDGRAYPPASPEAWEALPGVRETLEALRREGFRIIVVTNQPDVATGATRRETVEAIHQRLRSQLPVDDIKVCFHADADGCGCRKPRPGMLLEVAQEWGINLGASYMVGDRWRDIEAGRAAGCRTILVERGYAERKAERPDAVVASLPEAGELIRSGRHTVPATRGAA